MNTLPVIDLHGLADNSRLQPIADQIKLAMKSSGFMYISNHGIDEQAINRLRNHQVDFFNLPTADKERISISQDNRGYLGHGKARMHGAKKLDQKEVFFWGAELPEQHPDRLAGLPLCGPNQWPEQPAGFRDAVLDYSNAINLCGNNLLRAMALALGIDEHFFESRYTSPMLRGQLIHYPPTLGEEDDFGVAPHTDFGCITLLLQQTAGLEVLDKSEQWMAAPPIEGTLVVNVGDLLERWTDGRLPSTRHRVRNLTGDERYSIAMFHDPDPSAIVDAKHIDASANNFEAVTAADYISGRNTGAFSHYTQFEQAPEQTAGQATGQTTG